MDTGLASLTLVARFLGVATEPAAMAHDLALSGAPATQLDLLRAAKRLGLKAKQLPAEPSILRQLPLPAIARSHRKGDFVVVARADESYVLIQHPGKAKPEKLSIEQFKRDFDCRLLLVTKRSALPQAMEQFNLSWFLPAVARYRSLLGEILLASFVLQLFALMTPLFFQVVIDKVLVHRGLTTLNVLFIGLIAIGVFETVLSGLRTYVFTHTTNRIDVELGARLFAHLMALPMAYFGARRVGDSVARVRELENIRTFLTGSALTVVIDSFFTVVFLALMFWYSPLLAWVTVAAIPAYVVLSLVITPALRSRLDHKFARGAENQAFLVESVSGIETIKSMSVEPQMRRRWEDQLAEYVRASFRATNLGNIAAQTAQLINKLVIAVTLWLGARLVMEGELSVGQLVALNMLAGRVSGPILRLVQLWQDFQQTGISLKRLGDILNTPREPSHGTRTRLPEVKGEIRMDDLMFRYQPGGAPVLNGITLRIPAGEVIGLVGPSGSGKSTLAKLIQRLYVPESGRVSLDGADLALLDPNWLRRNIGVVGQDNTLFNRTVRENIALPDPAMPLEQVSQAARLAGAHEFILELPQGYDTILGEHGSNLSGGQRQRIAIARALATQPRILIFDEATSALDYESERVIQDNMRSICRGRTVLIIAHRLSTVRNANRIVVVERGRITEAGTHGELLKKQGRYAWLHAHQTGELETAE